MADGGSFIVDRAQLAQVTEKLIRAHLRAGKQSVADVAREFELKLEARTREAGGGKLARAFKSEVRPKGARIAREPAGFIYLNGGARTRGAVNFLGGKGRVASKTEGGYLAIPLPAAGSRGRARDLTPGEWERRTGVRLRYVYRGSRKPALLVADVGTTNGRTGVFRPLTAKRTKADDRRGFRRGEQTVPIFVLIAPFSFTGRFSIDRVMDAAPAALVRTYTDKAAAIGEVR